ncbi:MAG: hypothetical protein ACLPVY_22705 [Acidimicrobiia bacterium]
MFRQGAVGTIVWDPEGISILSPQFGQVSVYIHPRYNVAPNGVLEDARRQSLRS